MEAYLIKTARLGIRRIAADDWKDIQAIWEDFNASDYVRFDCPHSTDAETVRRQVARWASVRESCEHMFFTVCLEDRLIGFAAFHAREGSHELSYSFRTDVHGKGYAKESISAILSYLKTLGFTSFSAGTALINTPSVSLLKSLGFTLITTEKVSFYEGESFDGGLFELKK